MSKQAKGRASGTVLSSGFLNHLAHCAVVAAACRQMTAHSESVMADALMDSTKYGTKHLSLCAISRLKFFLYLGDCVSPLPLPANYQLDS